MDLITVASSGNVMLTNAAVSPGGRLFANFPRWTDGPTPSVGEATADGGFTPFPGGEWNEWRPGAKLVQIDLATNRVSRVYALGKDLAPSGAVSSHLRVDARFLYVTDSGFPNSQAPRVNRPHEVFKVELPR